MKPAEWWRDGLAGSGLLQRDRSERRIRMVGASQMTTNGVITGAIVCLVILLGLAIFGVREYVTGRAERKEAKARDGAIWVEHTEFRDGLAYVGMRCVYQWKGEKKMAGFAKLGKPIDLNDTAAVEQARSKAADTAITMNTSPMPWGQIL